MRRKRFGVKNFQRSRYAAGAAIFKPHGGLDVLLAGAAIKRVDQDTVLVGNGTTAHFARAGQFAVVGIQFFVQHQKAADLAARQECVLGEVSIDFFNAVANEGADLWLAGQIGVARVGQVAALGPIAHGFHVDVDEGADLLAPVAKGHGLFDVWEELELVLDVLGRKQRGIKKPALQTPNVFGAVDDLKVPARIEEARVAGVKPSVGGEYLGGGLGVFVIGLEQPG